MQRSTRVASTLFGAFVLSVSTIVWAPVATAEQKSSINVPVAHIEGRGHGHGVGMSQWGAYTMARDGADAAQIIATFYPGTELGTAGGEVVVGVDRGDRVQVQFPQGGEVRSARSGPQAAGFPVQVPAGGTVELIRDGAGYSVAGGTVAPLSGASATPYRSASSGQGGCFLLLCPPDEPDEPDEPTTTTTAPPASSPGGGGGGGGAGGGGGGGGGGESPSTTAPPPSTTTPSAPRSSTPLWATPTDGGTVRAVGRARTYRGLLEFTGGPGGARLRNHVDIEHYLAGMAEVPGSWPAAAVQAQAIAARTYALRAMAASGEICDSESCQVYKGVDAESAGQRAAVTATAGTVVYYGGGYAATFYSASAGGFTATAAEGFGSGGDIPYLRAAEYETAHPDIWSLDLALTDVAKRLGYPGTIEDIRIDRTGPSGRAVAMTLVGDAGERPVDPQDFRRRLGLRSTLFTVTSSEAEKPPPPPPPSDDTGVVGASAPDLDEVAAVRPIAPVRTPSASLGPLPVATDAPAPAVPLALAGFAVLLILATASTATAHVGSRQRLHPVFALGTVVADVAPRIARNSARSLGRSLMRRSRQGVATMAAWRNRRG